MEIREYTYFQVDEILELYAAVGWTNYTKRAELLSDAYRNSLCAFGAYENGKLVGIVRAVGDGVSIVFIQDIIVLPQYQRRGIGTKLLKTVMERFDSVYQMELLTDDTIKTKAFYRSVGFAAAEEIDCTAFVKMR